MAVAHYIHSQQLLKQMGCPLLLACSCLFQSQLAVATSGNWPPRPAPLQASHPCTGPRPQLHIHTPGLASAAVQHSAGGLPARSAVRQRPLRQRTQP